MIQRLLATLRELERLTPEALAAPAAAVLRADCADALRLQLDCPQGELGPSARAVLRRLDDLLEDPSPPVDALPLAVRSAIAVLGGRPRAVRDAPPSGLASPSPRWTGDRAR